MISFLPHFPPTLHFKRGFESVQRRLDFKKPPLGKGRSMIYVLLFGTAAGAIVALRRYKVFVLAPVMAIVAASSVANDVASGHTILFGLVAAIVSPQVGYVMMAAAATEFLHFRVSGQLPMLFRAMQMMIGQELRTVYELPQEVPPEMVALLTRMNR